jgi:uncharacterized protein involved in outer membrane biogenesis
MDASGCGRFVQAPRAARIRDNAVMKRWAKWLLATVVFLVLLLGGVALALRHWVGSTDFRDRVAAQISAALGVPVQLGGIAVDVWPLPAVALDQVQIKSRPALTLERIEARPVWAGLLQRKLEIATLVVRNAVVPEPAVAAITAGLKKPPHAAAGAGADPGLTVLPRRIVLDGVTWVDSKGVAMTVDARAQLADDGLPTDAEVTIRKGRFEGSKAKLHREADHWALDAGIGGGTVKGKFQVKPDGKGASLLQGQFDTANVEVSALTAPSATLTGRIEAHTDLHATFRDPGTIADVLQTETKFTVHNAVVHGIDLEKAVKSVGLNRGGETHLNTLAGNVSTQGHAVQLSNLVATSGKLSANGTIAMAPNRSLNGRVTVDLASAAAGGAIGVPLAVGGTLDSPSVTLTRGALVGAAIGTAIAPGLGTDAGAKLGDKLGQGLKGLFGK